MSELANDMFFMDDGDSGSSDQIKLNSSPSVVSSSSSSLLQSPTSASCSSSTSQTPASCPKLSSKKTKKKMRATSAIDALPTLGSEGCVAPTATSSSSTSLAAATAPVAKKKKKKRVKATAADLSPITEAEKVGHMKLVHRALKKAQKMSIAKLTRKLKEESQQEEEVSSPSNSVQDLEIYKSLEISSLTNEAWNMHEVKTKPLSNAVLPLRVRELSLLLLHSPIVKKAFQEILEKRIKEHQHKLYLKNKKKSAKAEVVQEKGNAKLAEKLCKLREGEVVQGIVDGVESFGVFVDFWAKKQQYRGLVHISEVTGEKIDRLQDYFDIGDPIRPVVLKIDRENLRVSLSLQKKYYPPGDPGWVVASNRFRKVDGTTMSAAKPEPLSLESTFVASLKGSAPLSDVVEKKKKKSQLVKLLAMAKGVSQKRMGQRQRQELLTGLYGDAGVEQKSSRTKNTNTAESRKPFKPIGRAEQKRRKRLREGGTDEAKQISEVLSGSAPNDSQTKGENGNFTHENSSVSDKKVFALHAKKPKRQKLAPASASMKDAPKVSPPQGSDVAENLHPSWAAKRKEGALPEYKGKRVFFE